MTLSEIPDPHSGKPTSIALIFKQPQKKLMDEYFISSEILKKWVLKERNL